MSGSVPGAALSLTLFGPMQVRVQGSPLPRLRSRRTLWLLALLTLRHGRPVEREWLANSLWPDAEPRQALASLRAVLSELRGVLGSESERLQVPTRQTLSLDLADAEVDLLVFDAAVARGDLPLLEQAVDLYRGPLLEGCAEEWITQDREAREQDCLKALQTLAEAAMAGEDHAAAAGYWRRAVALAPLWDDAQRGLMQALADTGDSNAALQVYQKFVLHLQKGDPKAQPDTETKLLYHRLRREARRRVVAPGGTEVVETPAPEIPGRLPQPLTELIGRTEERQEVAERLRRSRLVTLTGPGGIGKTRLALAVGEEASPEYPDGVWFVALEALADPALVPQAIAQVLGIRETAGRPLAQTLAVFLKGKRLLLVLDNCEHLLEASAQTVTHLLTECPEIRVLVTSREGLGVTGETAWAVPPLEAPPASEHLPADGTALLRMLKGYESVQLFVERAGAVHRTFALTGENVPAVARICTQLEGLPLAIELAAARVRVMRVEQIAERLHDRFNSPFGILTGGDRAASSRQQTLRATLDWSYALLGEAERALLRRLSVFAGGWDLDAAEAVCAGDGIATEEILDLLISLVDKSLVVFEEREPEGGRYRLLEMVRQYAAEKLQASGEAEPVQAAHRDWFMALAEESDSQLRGRDQQRWLRRLETEYSNLRAAMEEGEAEAQAGLRLAGALWRFWRLSGRMSEGRRYLAQALGREGAQQPTVARAKALNSAGALAVCQGDFSAAQTLHETSLDLARRLQSKPEIISALISLGVIATVRSDYATATRLQEESLHLARDLKDKPGMATSLSNLGDIARLQGHYTSARTLLEEASAIRRELGDKVGMALSLNHLGCVEVALGRSLVAKALFEESLAIHRELGDKRGIALSLNDIGLAHLLEDLFPPARALFQESLDIFRSLEDNVSAAWTLNHLGTVAYGTGEFAEAKTLWTEGLLLFRAVEDHEGIAKNLKDMAAVFATQAEAAKAVRLWASAAALRKGMGAAPPPDELEETGEYLGQPHLWQTRAILGEDAYAAAWEEGYSLPWKQAVAYALGEAGAPPD